MLRTALCAIALICAGTAGFACNGNTKQTQSCAEGTIWDSESQSCMKIVNS